MINLLKRVLFKQRICLLEMLKKTQTYF